MKGYARPVGEVPVQCLSCSAPVQCELQHRTRFRPVVPDHQKTHPRTCTAAGAASCDFNSASTSILGVFKELRVDIAFEEIRIAQDLPMQRNCGLHALQYEHIQGAIHAPDRLIARRTM